MSSLPELIVANISDTVQLAYLDSGPVPNSNDFVTIVIVHGCLFNAYNLERLIPFAHQYNIRLIFMMRRDYPGSSPFTNEEKALAAGDWELSFKQSGALYLQFMHHILKTTHVCKATEDRSKGGICLGGWSLGDSFAMWVLQDNELVDTNIYNDLEPYFTTYVFIEPPVLGLGIPTPRDVEIYDPVRADDGMESFREWVTSYFSHPSPWDGIFAKLDQRGGLGRKSSISGWTDDEIKRWISDSCTGFDSMVLSDELAQSCLARASTEILFGQPKRFPRLRIEYLCGAATCWSCLVPWNTFSTKRAGLKYKGEDNGLRRMTFTEIMGGNHFMHTDAPEALMKIITTRLEQRSDAYTTFCTVSLFD